MTPVRCTECGSDWPGYHSWSFCKLRKAHLPWKDAVLADMAKVADGKAKAVELTFWERRDANA